MQIVRKQEYLSALQKILSFIAQDSKSRAKQFKKQLDSKVNDLVHFPYKYRQSIHHHNVEVRDLIYKGYTIVYRINKNAHKIEVIEIFKWTK